ncbi:hypothetical protein BKA93DRAFT_757182 [Sparassis latifolia]
MAFQLPNELWLAIFNFAVEDETLFEHSLLTSMAESAWFKMIYGDWSLRAPQETSNLMQRRSYTTKTAIVSTCRTWRKLGSEFLFRCLFFNDPACLRKLCPVLDSDNHLGWWTKRLHITRYYAVGGVTMDDMEHVLVSTIRRCPNLEIFVVNWSISTSLSSVINALCMYCPLSLRTLHIHIPPAALAKIILMLESLPRLVAVYLEFDGQHPETLHLGSASGIALSLPKLRQLSLRGSFQEFIEQAIGWTMPALDNLSLDFLNYREDIPDIIEFLTHHGSNLTFLDINCIPALEVATILDLCPLLTTFCFNLDWRLPVMDNDPLRCALVHRPHANITTIGCHQLLYAFGVGYAATYATVDPLTTHVVRRRNDVNFAALNKQNFPRLQCVRVLSRMLLRDLEAADGPHESCFERWERWWNQCASQRVRLEDCTGALFGTLPLNDDQEEEEKAEKPELAKSTPEQGLVELRQLLAECKQMSNAVSHERFGRQYLLQGQTEY